MSGDQAKETRIGLSRSDGERDLGTVAETAGDFAEHAPANRDVSVLGVYVQMVIFLGALGKRRMVVMRARGWDVGICDSAQVLARLANPKRSVGMPAS